MSSMLEWDGMLFLGRKSEDLRGEFLSFWSGGGISSRSDIELTLGFALTLVKFRAALVAT